MRLLVVLALLFSTAFAATGDNWLGFDKATHGIAATGLTAGATILARQQLNLKPWQAVAVGGGAVAGACLVKELCDRDFSLKDLAVGGIGIASGAGLAQIHSAGMHWPRATTKGEKMARMGGLLAMSATTAAILGAPWMDKSWMKYPVVVVATSGWTLWLVSHFVK